MEVHDLSQVYIRAKRLRANTPTFLMTRVQSYEFDALEKCIEKGPNLEPVPEHTLSTHDSFYTWYYWKRYSLLFAGNVTASFTHLAIMEYLKLCEPLYILVANKLKKANLLMSSNQKLRAPDQVEQVGHSFSRTDKSDNGDSGRDNHPRNRQRTGQKR